MNLFTTMQLTFKKKYLVIYFAVLGLLMTLRSLVATCGIPVPN